MKRISTFMIGLLSLIVLAKASPVTCNPNTTNDVTTLGSLACAGSGDSFSNFTVSGTGPNQQIGLTGMTYDALSGMINLFFSIVVPPATPGDLILGYEVTGPSTGIDFNVAGSPNLGAIVFTESACSTQLCNGDKNVIYATIGNAGPVQQNSASFSSQNPVWIKKDINFDSSTSQLTDFVNSHETAVPEPISLSLVGGGLLMMGLFGRRHQKKGRAS